MTIESLLSKFKAWKNGGLEAADDLTNLCSNNSCLQELQNAVENEMILMEQAGVEYFDKQQEEFLKSINQIAEIWFERSQQVGGDVDTILSVIITSIQGKVAKMVEALVGIAGSHPKETAVVEFLTTRKWLKESNREKTVPKLPGTRLLTWIQAHGPQQALVKNLQTLFESVVFVHDSTSKRLENLLRRCLKTENDAVVGNLVEIIKTGFESSKWSVAKFVATINEWIESNSMVDQSNFDSSSESSHDPHFDLCNSLVGAALTWIIETSPEKIKIWNVFPGIKKETKFNALSHGWGAVVNLADESRSDHKSEKDSGLTPVSSQRKLAALKKLRSEGDIWIDIYENDKGRDTPLKQAQLLVMEDVYREAEVVYWLPTDRDWVIMEHFKAACEFPSIEPAQRAEIIRFFSSEVKSKTFTSLGVPKYDATSLLTHSTRGWPLQEFVLAKSVHLLDLDGEKKWDLGSKQTDSSIRALYAGRRKNFVCMDGIPRETQERAATAIDQLFKDLQLIGIGNGRGGNRTDRGWVRKETTSQRECEVEKDIFWCTRSLTQIRPTFSYKQSFDHSARHYVMLAFSQGLFAPGVIQKPALDNNAVPPLKVRGMENTSWLPYEMFFSDDNADLTGTGKINRLRWITIAANSKDHVYFSNEHVRSMGLHLDGSLVLNGEVSKVKIKMSSGAVRVEQYFRVSELGFIKMNEDKKAVEGFVRLSRKKVEKGDGKGGGKKVETQNAPIEKLEEHLGKAAGVLSVKIERVAVETVKLG
ncbi:hypothetical protein HDU98_009381 [Podochytrium sp. JEL0797]|nr:hypothetical protein HDU98_009381 [Podochytrium sp. JEL0797]